MKLVLIAVAVAGLTAAVAPARADGDDCQLKQISSIDIENTPGGPVILVSLEGTPARLHLMLEDSISTLNQSVVQALNLDDRYKMSLAAIKIARVQKFGLGQIPAQPEQFAEMPSAFVVPDADGKLGTLPLSRADFELDLAHGKLNLFRADHCPGKAVYWTAPGNVADLPLDIDFDGGITAHVELEGKPVHVVFRTDGPSYIKASAAKYIFGLDETSPGMAAATSAEAGLHPANGHDKVYSYSFKTLSAGGLQIGNPKFLVVPDTPEADGLGRLCLRSAVGVRCPPKPDIAIGLSVLSKLRLYFSLREKVLYLTTADAK